MFYWQSLKTVWLLVLFTMMHSASGSSSEQDAYLRDIAFRHVLFEQYQGNHRDAYIAADYYQKRDLKSESIQLTQAAASLELGFLEHGRALVAELEHSTLLPENQARLHLYLARDAYQRRDWTKLEAQLSLLASQTLTSSFEKNFQAYLHIELANHQKHFAEASRYLAGLDDDFRYRPHAMFNVAVALSEQERVAAIPLLNALLDVIPQNLAGFTLRDRARVAISEIYIEQEESQAARNTLVKVSANHRYGPYALAQIARLDMAGERYEDAAAIWQYLLQQHTWHRASTHAVSGLGFALQQSRGDEAAFLVYTEGLKDMASQQQRLSLAGERIRAELQDPELFDETSEPLLIWLSDTLGNDDWLDWLASTEIRTLVARWQALSTAHEKLRADDEHLTSLLAVDAEQQRRIIRANEAVRKGDLPVRVTAIRNEIDAQQSLLLNTTFTFGHDLESFASDGQRLLLEEILLLKQRIHEVAELSEDLKWRDDVVQRLARLEGLVRYEVFDQLPVNKQRLLSHYASQLQQLDETNARLSRIVGAADRQPESVGVRIQQLVKKRQQLEQETLVALGFARQQVLASLDHLVQGDHERLQNQMAGLQYDVTRLADRRLASEVSP